MPRVFGPVPPPKIEPMAEPAKSGKGKLAAAVGATAAALLIGMVAQYEGKSNDPYKDVLAGGLLTVCYGETRAPMHHYTDAECSEMLADSLSGYGKTVLERNPELRGHPYQLAAAASLTYNIGGTNYRRSTVAKRFSAGNWKGACDAFLAWHYAGGKPVKGLLNRRNAERRVCLTDIGR
jgi:lysozyme